MYVIVGTDATLRGNARRKLLKKKQAEEFAWSDVEPERLAMLASTPALLGDSQAFLLVGALSDAQKGEDFVAMAGGLMESPHTFIFEEEKLLKGPTTKLEKAGVTVTVLAQGEKKETFNVFALANALGNRDRKQFWLLLTKAAHTGVAPENIAGVLHWKVRDMLAKGAAGKYSKEELTGLSRELMELYHDSHRGRGELSLLLERFALTL